MRIVLQDPTSRPGSTSAVFTAIDVSDDETARRRARLAPGGAPVPAALWSQVTGSSPEAVLQLSQDDLQAVLELPGEGVLA